MKLLWVIALALFADLFTGLTLNLYGFGREPLGFALAAIVAGAWLYQAKRTWLGMMLLTLCCLWLMLYPTRNGFDVVLSPMLLTSCALWAWKKFKNKNKSKNENRYATTG
ncbi:MAG: hypothetical protein QM533_07380 [Cytophagales bacterium]|nr:hypothetical protein [Cytophagales bacterium]